MENSKKDPSFKSFTSFRENMRSLELLLAPIGCKALLDYNGFSTQETSKCHESTAHLGADQMNSYLFWAPQQLNKKRPWDEYLLQIR